ncbi:hypothetical protein GCM10025858_31250 [Alicyclobacillus sacchari]|nr:hypothetical protein GCM10025858_31250 [Alicyclobacillus sacchari]
MAVAKLRSRSRVSTRSGANRVSKPLARTSPPTIADALDPKPDETGI